MLPLFYANPHQQSTISISLSERYNKIQPGEHQAHSSRQEATMESTHITKAKDFISAHLKKEFSLNELAAHVSYSAFHLSREFKAQVGVSIMEHTRNQRILAAAEDLKSDGNIFDIALDYCFETHGGFTNAFNAIIGCTPTQYQAYVRKMKTKSKGVTIMQDSRIVIRHICKDDVQDLWENVYSAMTPRQITEVKILPQLEAYNNHNGVELVAEVDGKIVMTLPMSKPSWIPLGFIWDNNFTLTGGDSDIIMEKLLDEMKNQARMLGVNTLISSQYKDSESSIAMQSLGFQKAFESGEWEYLMLAI